MSIHFTLASLGVATVFVSSNWIHLTAGVRLPGLAEKLSQDGVESRQVGFPANFTVLNTTLKTIEISWDPPDINLSSILNYVIIYNKASLPFILSHGERSVESNVTTFLIKGLVPGTRYNISVAANSTTGVTHSASIIQQTDGYGLDNPCSCDPLGIDTQLPDENKCNQYTGECICRNKYTRGSRCDQCETGYYWHPKIGCQACTCIKDGFHSDGACYTDANNVLLCQCLHNFVGMQCDMCENSAYMDKKGFCEPCECNGNAQPNAPHQCDQKGKCIACDRNTTGSQCQMCKDGYVGNALFHNCTLPEDLVDTKESSHHRRIQIVAGVTMMMVLVILAVMTIFLIRRCQRQHKPLQLWTVALQDNGEEVDFASRVEDYGPDQHLLKGGAPDYSNSKSCQPVGALVT